MRRPALLHEHRRQPRVERARLEQRRRARPATGAGRGRRRSPPGRPRRRPAPRSGPASSGSPRTRRSTFASSCGSRPPAPEPLRRSTIGGSGPYAETTEASTAAPVGVVISLATGPASTGTPCSSATTAGGGTGSGPCAPAGGARPQDDRTGRQPGEPEGVETRCGADDVGDGVERTDLVEVHLVRRGPVDGGLGGGEPGEDVERRRAHRLAEVGPLEQAADVGPRARAGRLVDDDVDLAGAETGPGHRRALEAHRLDADAVDGVLQHREVDPDVDQRAQQHVAGDARGAVEPADHLAVPVNARCVGRRARRRPLPRSRCRC